MAGITPADLGFKGSHRPPSQSAEASQDPAPTGTEEPGIGQADVEQNATGTPEGEAEAAQEDTGPVDEPVEAEPLPQRPPRKRRQRKGPREAGRRKPPEAPQEPKITDPPIRTRTGRAVRAPKRYGWD